MKFNNIDQTLLSFDTQYDNEEQVPFNLNNITSNIIEM